MKITTISLLVPIKNYNNFSVRIKTLWTVILINFLERESLSSKTDLIEKFIIYFLYSLSLLIWLIFINKSAIATFEKVRDLEIMSGY